jgi:hypothetical protein
VKRKVEESGKYSRRGNKKEIRKGNRKGLGREIGRDFEG